MLSIDRASVPEPPLLVVDAVTVDYPGVRALERVDLSLRPGEIHALLGENGAGKSTLIRVLSGGRAPDSGRVAIAGAARRFRSPRDAEAAGVSTVYQEIDLIPSLSVVDNLLLGRQPTRGGLIRGREMRSRAGAAIARLGLRLDLDRTLSDYPIATQQLVAIARALDIDARVLILDEPTSSLDRRETTALFDVLRRLRDDGLALLFVTHFLDQVYELCDRITVLRNGIRVGEWLTRELPRPALIEAMTGRPVGITEGRAPTDAVPDVAAAADDSTAAPQASSARLSIQKLARRGEVAPTSVDIPPGRALGLAGLLGAGRTELARLIFGATRPDGGEIRVDGRSIRRGSIRAAIRAGIGFTPEDRKAAGLVLDLSVRENIVLALQARRGTLRPLGRTEQDRLTNHYISALRIRTPTGETPVGSLSGGNQQKVLLARWLALQPRVLILDEPTRGIDVGARAEIEALIAGLRRDGIAIVLVSSELDEIVRVCTDVLVLRDRRPVGRLADVQVSESAILATLAGETRAGA